MTTAGRWSWVLLLVLATACDSTVRSTTEHDPAAMATSTYWQGVFWVAVAIASGLVAIVWVVMYYWAEREKNRLARTIEEAELERERKQFMDSARGTGTGGG